MCYSKKVMVMILALALALSLCVSGFAAGSPTGAPSSAPTTAAPTTAAPTTAAPTTAAPTTAAPTVPADWYDANTVDHINKTVNSRIYPNGEVGAATVFSVDSQAGMKSAKNVSFKVARDYYTNLIPITQIGDGTNGVFDSEVGRVVTEARVQSFPVDGSGVTIAKYAFKGSKVKVLKLKSNKITIQKNAFNGTKTKNPVIYIYGSKKKAKAFTFKSGAFKGLNNKAKVYVNPYAMSKTEFAKLKKALKKAGFKGTITRKAYHN